MDNLTAKRIRTFSSLMNLYTARYKAQTPIMKSSIDIRIGWLEEYAWLLVTPIDPNTTRGRVV